MAEKKAREGKQSPNLGFQDLATGFRNLQDFQQDSKDSLQDYEDLIRETEDAEIFREGKNLESIFPFVGGERGGLVQSFQCFNLQLWLTVRPFGYTYI